jgi:pilus assembly protein CpaB
MDRRFGIVLGVSLLFALVVTMIFYQMASGASSGSPAQAAPVETADVVVAAHPLESGVSVKPDDVKIMKLPASAVPKGSFSKVEEVIDRPVVSNILIEEPILEGRLAARGAGIGLAPKIPVGMRAMSVRVNDVVGVAGYVLPGMHVDVLVTGQPPGDAAATVTTTALQDITVLTAGAQLQSDARGQAINTPVVTLLVTPEQAEVLTLAGNETKIQLVLRNSADKTVNNTRGRGLSELYRGNSPLPVAEPRAVTGPRPARRRPVETTKVVLAPAPAAPVPPPPNEVVVIRGNQKSVEVVSKRPGTAE